MKVNCINLLLQVDCYIAESFYALNDNIEAYADAYQDIEKPFLQPYEGDQDRSSYDQTASFDNILLLLNATTSFNVLSVQKDQIVRENAVSFKRVGNLGKLLNSDLVASKRRRRSVEAPLDEEFGKYLLAADEEIDLISGSR